MTPKADIDRAALSASDETRAVIFRIQRERDLAVIALAELYEAQPFADAAGWEQASALAGNTLKLIRE